jgi:hypothetical protein
MGHALKIFKFLSLLILLLLSYFNLSISQGVRCFCDFCVMEAFNFCVDFCESHGGCESVDFGESYCYDSCCCNVPYTIKSKDLPPMNRDCFCFHPICEIEPREPGPPPGPTSL